jgi:glycerol-3-phosphate dehydrogenase
LGDRGDFRHRVSGLAERYSTSLDLCTHLLSVYGSRAAAVLDTAGRSEETGKDRLEPFCPGLKHVWAEVDYAIRNEMALTLKDVLIRRTLAGLKAARQSAEIAPKAAARMARLLDWDAEEQKRQVESFHRWVESSLRALD